VLRNHRRVAGWAGLFVAALAAGLLGSAPAHGIAGGAPAAAGAYGFVAKVEVGDRSCSGALIDRQWVVTAASCFPENVPPGQTAPTGVPKKATTATVGRTDLSGTAGQVRAVVELVGRPEQNVVLAKLASPVPDAVAPVSVATAAPTSGEVLRVAGYGRTSTEWVPDLLQTARFVVQGVTGTSLDIVGHTPPEAAVCKGDSGGPAFREAAGGRVELVAIHDRSWQNGCFGETETRRGATETRVDTLADWIRQVTDPSVARAGQVVGVDGLCLEVRDGRTEDGAGFQLASCVGHGPQFFTSASDGSLRVLGKCLDMAGPMSDFGSRLVHLYTCNGTDPQKWQLRADGSVVTAANGHCLDGTFGKVGSPITTFACHGGGNQRWTLPAAPARFGQVHGVAGLCLDVRDGRTEDGTGFQLAACVGSAPQLFTLTGDGLLRVLGKCLDMAGPMSDFGSRLVHLYTCNGTDPQKWEPRPDGSFVTAANGHCLDGTFGKVGSPITTHPCHGGGNNQRWTPPTIGAVTPW
jgi:hypothetical protein